MNSFVRPLAFILLATPAAAQCPPVLLNCPAAPQTICDETPNDAFFWNTSAWWSPLYQTHDLPEGPVDLGLSVQHNCPAGSVAIRYILELDLDADGTRETLVDSDALPGWNTIYFNNANADSLTGGTARSFDERPVLPTLKYGFALETLVSNDTTTARLRWNTEQNPNQYTLPQLPHHTNHRIVWIVTQGITADTCAWEFRLTDCKKPYIACINGLSVNIMPTKIVTLWDSDFLQFTEDNITAVNLLETGIRKSGTGVGFPLNPDGTPQKSVTYACDDLGTNLIELWSRDLTGNADYCETYVIVQDNMSQCSNSPGSALTCVKFHCDDQPMDEVAVVIAGSHPALPPIGLTNNYVGPDGCWSPSGVSLPLSGNYSLELSKDNDHLNGLSTFDLVLINKHILGLEPLNSPYNLIAADANGSRSVTTFDIVELRKLVLGVYQELPNNTSWRFIPSDYVFPNPNNPFQQTYPTTVLIGSTTTFPVQFTGIKIGDVNCSAVYHSVAAPPVDRTVRALALPNAQLSAGQILETALYSPEEADWQGLQFALEFDSEQLSLEAVTPGALPGLDEAAYAQPRPGMLTLSWFNAQVQALPAGAPLLTLRWRAKKAVQLSESVRLAPKQLQPEAYTEAGETQVLELLFGSPTAPESASVFNPQPNPTTGPATIPIRLPAEQAVLLEVFGFAGRLVFQQELLLPAGLHRLNIPAEVMLQPGVFFWNVQVGREAVRSGKLLRF